MIALEKIPRFACDPIFVLDPASAKYVVGRPVDGPVPTMENLISCVYEPGEIKELAGLDAAYSGMRIGVVIVPDSDDLGVCFSSDSHEALVDVGLTALLALNPQRLGGHTSIQDLFLHEVAHIHMDEIHDWKFLSILNAMRVRCGFSPSFDPYDIRDGVEFTSLPQAVKSDIDLLQRWCAEVGSALAKLPDFTESVLGAVWELERMLEAIDEATAKPESLLALAEEFSQVIGTTFKE